MTAALSRQLLAKLFIGRGARCISGLGLGALNLLLNDGRLPIESHQILPHVIIELFGIIRVVVLLTRLHRLIVFPIYSILGLPRGDRSLGR